MIRWLGNFLKEKVNNKQETIDSKTDNKISDEVKKVDTKINVSEWVKGQMASGIPLMDLWRQLMEESAKINDLQLLQEYMNASSKIEDILVSRNLEGKQYEQDGDDNNAIKLYEENIKDRFDGSHPYERLKVIYTKQKRYKDVIRICKSYIDNGQPDAQLKAKYEGIIIKLREKIDQN